MHLLLCRCKWPLQSFGNQIPNCSPPTSVSTHTIIPLKLMIVVRVKPHQLPTVWKELSAIDQANSTNFDCLLIFKACLLASSCIRSLGGSGLIHLGPNPSSDKFCNSPVSASSLSPDPSFGLAPGSKSNLKCNPMTFTWNNLRDENKWRTKLIARFNFS